MLDMVKTIIRWKVDGNWTELILAGQLESFDYITNIDEKHIQRELEQMRKNGEEGF